MISSTVIETIAFEVCIRWKKLRLEEAKTPKMCGWRTRMLGCEHPGTRHDKYLDRLLIPERK